MHLKKKITKKTFRLIAEGKCVRMREGCGWLQPAAQITIYWLWVIRLLGSPARSGVDVTFFWSFHSNIRTFSVPYAPGRVEFGMCLCVCVCVSAKTRWVRTHNREESRHEARTRACSVVEKHAHAHKDKATIRCCCHIDCHILKLSSVLWLHLLSALLIQLSLLH